MQINLKRSCLNEEAAQLLENRNKEKVYLTSWHVVCAIPSLGVHIVVERLGGHVGVEAGEVQVGELVRAGGAVEVVLR